MSFWVNFHVYMWIFWDPAIFFILLASSLVTVVVGNTSDWNASLRGFGTKDYSIVELLKIGDESSVIFSLDSWVNN